VLTNLDHGRQWSDTLIPPSHESAIRLLSSPETIKIHHYSELRRRRASKCKAASGNMLLVAGRLWRLCRQLVY